MTKFWFGKDKSWARWWDVLPLNVNWPNIQHFPNQHMLLWEEKPFFIFLNMFLLIKLEKPGWRSNIEDKFVGWHLSWRNLLLTFAAVTTFQELPNFCGDTTFIGCWRMGCTKWHPQISALPFSVRSSFFTFFCWHCTAFSNFL